MLFARPEAGAASLAGTDWGVVDMAGGGWQFYLGVLGQLQDSLRQEIDYPCLETKASGFRPQFGKELPSLGLSFFLYKGS